MYDTRGLSGRNSSGLLCVRFSRYALACLLVASPASAQLWPGQSSALGFVPFEGGAYGVVVGASSDRVEVQVWNGTAAVSSWLSQASGGWSQTATGVLEGVGNLSVDKAKLWAWAKATPGRAIAGPIGLGLQAALTPSALADGTLCSSMIGGAGSLAYDSCSLGMASPCQAIWDNRLWIEDGPCITSGANKEYLFDTASSSVSPTGDWFYWWFPATFSGYDAYLSGEDYLLYPSRGGTHILYGEKVETVAEAEALAADSGTTSFAACLDTDITSCAEPVLGATQQANVDAQLGPVWDSDTHPTVEGFAPAPDIYQPIPLPPSLAGKTLEELNPGGVAVPDDVTTAPVAVPGVTAHAGSGTGTGTDAGTGTATTSVTVDFPASMDVTILNQPEYEPPDASAWALPDLDIEGLDLPTASPGTKWLGATCPQPTPVEVGGAAIVIDWSVLCTPLGWLGIIVNLAGGLTCCFIAFKD